MLSLAANAWFFLRWEPKAPSGEAEGPLTEAVRGVTGQQTGEAPVPAAAAEAPAAPTPMAVEDLAIDRPRRVHVTIDGPVARAFTDALGSGTGDRVAMTTGRLLAWKLDIRTDPRKGDTADVLFRLDPNDPAAVHIDALHYRSAKFGGVFEVYRFRPEGQEFASWYDAQGQEIPARLKTSPLDSYEQITSLIGDGRGHSGMDFKAPVGTPVKAPFDGSVRRVNWNWKYNGNSLEVATSGGRLVRFLHLSKVAGNLPKGARVHAGQVVGATGNTGRSFAPHLHYEIVDSGGRVLDPLEVHGVERGAVPAASKEAFETERNRLRLALKAAEDAATPPEEPAPEASPSEDSEG